MSQIFLGRHLAHERQIAREQTEQRDKTIADLRQQLAQRGVETNALKAARGNLENDLHAADASRQDLLEQCTELVQKLEAVQFSSKALQQRLDSLAQQSAQDAAREKTFEAKVNDLIQLLQIER